MNPSGSDPSMVSIADVDSRSRLMTAARPVLDGLTARLDGIGVGVLLADRDCRVAFRWFGDREVQRQLESVGALPGAHFVEGRIGTNGMGTPYESQQAVVINGREHYVETLKRFSCYGHPIRHPLTGRIEGVLDISSVSARCNPLFGPLIARTANEIEERIVEGARRSERRLFLAFQEATQRRSAPVAVLGGDLVFANQACIEQLRPADPSLLRTLQWQVPERGAHHAVLEVADGLSVAVTAERIPDSVDGVLFQVWRAEPRSRRPAPRAQDARGPLLITGEPGTGRSTEARAVVGDDHMVLFDAATAVGQDAHEWAARFRLACAKPHTAVVVDDVHLFPENLLAVVAEALNRGCPARLVLIAGPADQFAPAVAAVTARCAETVALRPLAERLDELPALAVAMLGAERPEWRPRFTGDALAALRAHPWPGNLWELRAVMRDIAKRPSARVIDVAQLPPGYRSTVRTRHLGGRDLAERTAIVNALRATGGNKLHAARELGISRTTLYRRMRALDVSDDLPLA